MRDLLRQWREETLYQMYIASPEILKMRVRGFIIEEMQYINI